MTRESHRFTHYFSHYIDILKQRMKILREKLKILQKCLSSIQVVAIWWPQEPPEELFPPVKSSNFIIYISEEAM